MATTYNKIVHSLDKFVPESNHDFYIMVYSVLTFFMVIFYIFVYFGVQSNYGKQYLPIVVTARNIFLGLFLVYFYNPLRSKFEYGRTLPIFATAAGLALLLTIRKYDILNLVNFCLYGQLLPDIDKSECKLDGHPKKDIQISKTIQ